MSAPQKLPDHVCIGCHANGARKCCGRCMKPYCSRKCQMNHWPFHKAHCVLDVGCAADSAVGFPMEEYVPSMHITVAEMFRDGPGTDSPLKNLTWDGMGILSKIMYVYDSMLAAYEPEPAKKKLTELLGARGTPKYVDELCDWLGSYIAVNAGVAHVKMHDISSLLTKMSNIQKELKANRLNPRTTDKKAYDEVQKEILYKISECMYPDPNEAIAERRGNTQDIVAFLAKKFEDAHPYSVPRGSQTTGGDYKLLLSCFYYAEEVVGAPGNRPTRAAHASNIYNYMIDALKKLKTAGLSTDTYITPLTRSNDVREAPVVAQKLVAGGVLFERTWEWYAPRMSKKIEAFIALMKMFEENKRTALNPAVKTVLIQYLEDFNAICTEMLRVPRLYPDMLAQCRAVTEVAPRLLKIIQAF